MRIQKFLVRSGRALLVVTVIGAALLAAAELAVRGVYAYAFRTTERSPLVYERVFWAVPPWVHYTSMMYDDPELGPWTRPSTRRTYVNLFGPIGDLAEVGALFDSLFPELPDWARDRPVWHLETNAHGLRDRELVAEKAPGTFRIVVLGDSWTVGVNVESAETYASKLGALLAADTPGRKVEVLNFGVVGGRMESGRRLLPRVLALQPDMIVLAYAQNDEIEVRDARGKRARPPVPPGERPFRIGAVLRQLELVKLYRWWTTPGEDRIEATLRHQLTRPSGAPSNDPGRDCLNPDFADTTYHATLDDLVQRIGEAGVATVLVYNSVPDFSSHCTLRVLSSVAERRGVPLFDSSAVLETLERRIATDDEQRAGLVTDRTRRTTKNALVEVVLRVDMRTDPFGRPPSVMGNHPSLGAFVPNVVRLYDDGSHGDQRAGDGIWSRGFTLTDPQVLTYAFTNGAQPGAWTGLENYRLRAFAVRREDFGRTVYAPIAQFGRHTLRSDPSHPDAPGHAAIASALADTVRATPSFARFASAGADGRADGDARGGQAAPQQLADVAR